MTARNQARLAEAITSVHAAHDTHGPRAPLEVIVGALPPLCKPRLADMRYQIDRWLVLACSQPHRGGRR